MKRREFITLTGGAATVWPLTARAQQPSLKRRLGILMALPENDSEAHPRVSILKEKLEQLGWIEGKNLFMEFRWAGNLSIGTSAAELAGLTPDVILTTSTPTTKAVQQAAPTVPIVFVGVSDPISTGIVASLAKPGGNTTGFANYEFRYRRQVAGTAKGNRAKRRRMLL